MSNNRKQSQRERPRPETVVQADILLLITQELLHKHSVKFDNIIYS